MLGRKEECLFASKEEGHVDDVGEASGRRCNLRVQEVISMRRTQKATIRHPGVERETPVHRELEKR
jgi:hypothetical protein